MCLHHHRQDALVQLALRFRESVHKVQVEVKKKDSYAVRAVFF
jgi:hypothetical protein